MLRAVLLAEEIEKAVLGCCVLEPHLSRKVVTICDVSYFYSSNAKKLFLLIQKLTQVGDAWNFVVLVNRLRKEPNLLLFVMSCCESVEHMGKFGLYFKILQILRQEYDERTEFEYAMLTRERE